MDSDTNDGRQTMEVPVIKINDHESDENEYEMLLDDTEEYTRLAAPSPNDPSDESPVEEIERLSPFSHRDEGAIPPGNEIDDATSDDDSEHEITILDPEHPLMVRFQTALGSHLQQRNEQLTLEQRDLDAEMTRSVKERESVGVLLYSEQQVLAQYQAKLDKINQGVVANTVTRLSREAAMNDLRRAYRKMASQVDKSRDEAATMQKELENLNIRVFYFLNCKEDVESDVKVMRRATLKTRKNLEKSELAKKEQDYRVDLLQELVDSRQQEVEMFQAQFLAQQEETVKYKSLVVEAGVELEILRSEMKRIEDNWKRTLLGMKRRDDSLSNLIATLREEEQNLMCKDREYDAFKANILQAEEKHERLTHILARSENDIANSQKLLAKSQKRYDELRITYTQKSRMLREAQTAISDLMNTKKEVELKLRQHTKEYEEAILQRNELRVQLVDVLRTQSNHVKSAQTTKRQTDDCIARSIQMEMEMAEDENKLAVIEKDLLSREIKCQKLQEQLPVVREKIAELNTIADSYETRFGRNLIEIERRQIYICEANKRLATLLESTEGLEVSPLENLLNSITKTLRKESRSMLDDQTLWAEEQGNYLSLTKEKHDIAKGTRLRQNEIVILSGRKRKLDTALAEENHARKDLAVETSHLRLDMEKLSGIVFNKKGDKERLEMESYLAETDFIRELKEKEVEILATQQRLQDINSEKENLLNMIIQTERQTSLWQKKIQIGVEMKESVDPKKNECADLRMMTAEIHRMTLRYESLMKEQEKLIRQMEDTVTRRSYIVTAHQADVKRDPNLLTKSKCRRRVHEATNKTNKFKQQCVEMDMQKKGLLEERKNQEKKISGRGAALANLREKIANLTDEIAHYSAQKVKNLHDLVSRQRRGGLYESLAKGRYRAVCSDAADRQLLLDNEVQTMVKILSVGEKLKNTLPDAAPRIEQALCCYGSRSNSLQLN